MAVKASGREFIDCETNIIANIGEHFNKPDISDVTLTVGDQVFAAHRFVLATQSKVFMTMLMGENWRESNEKKIVLQESAEAEAAFSDFLKFFYTGTLILTIDDVCGIHTLADKYDVTLKDDCVDFMKDVLNGIHGDALKAALQWLQYVENFLPDLVALCYSAIRTNFIGAFAYPNSCKMLTSDQVQKILSVPEVSEELVLYMEQHLLTCIDRSQWGDKFLSFVRFYNIDIDELQSYQGKSNLEKYHAEAYKIHAERSQIAKKVFKRRRLSRDSGEATCPCDASSSKVCPHINPRLYLISPFGVSTKMPRLKTMLVEPIDLADLEAFSQKILYSEDNNNEMAWKIDVDRDYSGDPIYERYEVVPHRIHIGKQFTMVIACLLQNGLQMLRSEYVIKYTGVVDDEFDVLSPLRDSTSWQLSEDHRIRATVILHK